MSSLCSPIIRDCQQLCDEVMSRDLRSHIPASSGTLTLHRIKTFTNTYQSSVEKKNTKHFPAHSLSVAITRGSRADGSRDVCCYNQLRPSASAPLTLEIIPRPGRLTPEPERLTPQRPGPRETPDKSSPRPPTNGPPRAFV